jgi:ectoine hydroxylase-related dioxygenase (phytanoyl-CoA dioxygenase family)
LHIDDCNADNGPLRVIVGSHREGKIPEALIAQRVRDGEEATLTCAAGGILIMSPLVLHASSPAQSATHRRVLHIEYAGIDLPHPLRWHLDSAPL